MNQNVLVVLLALAFGAIGFTLGRVTCTSNCAPHHCCHGHHGQCDHHGCQSATCSQHGDQKVCKEVHEEVRVMTTNEDLEMDDVQGMVDEVLDSGFVGDTTLVIDGGEVMISRSGEDVSVEVVME